MTQEDWKNSAAHKAGQAYINLGMLLADPGTTIRELTAALDACGLDLAIRAEPRRPLEGPGDE